MMDNVQNCDKNAQHEPEKYNHLLKNKITNIIKYYKVNVYVGFKLLTAKQAKLSKKLALSRWQEELCLLPVPCSSRLTSCSTLKMEAMYSSEILAGG
jgi:hypothetical protein